MHIEYFYPISDITINTNVLRVLLISHLVQACVLVVNSNYFVLPCIQSWPYDTEPKCLCIES